MTTTASTTATRRIQDATEKTAETVKRGAQEVTEKTDQVFGQQLQTVDLAQGVERYFEFAQKTLDINRELATHWADAVTSLSGVVRDQTEKVESATRDQVDKLDQAEKTQTRRPRQSTNGHTNGHIEHTDEQNERLIDNK